MLIAMYWASKVVLQKSLPASAGDVGLIPGSVSILAWEISWTEEPGRLQSMGLQELETTEAT